MSYDFSALAGILIYSVNKNPKLITSLGLDLGKQTPIKLFCAALKKAHRISVVAHQHIFSILVMA